MEQWLSYLAGVIVAIIIVMAIHFRQVRRWYDNWILQHGDFLLFEAAEFNEYWNYRRDVRNKTVGTNYVFYLVEYDYHDVEKEAMYFRAPVAFEQMDAADKRIAFIMHYRHIFDITPRNVTMVFDCYM